MKFNALIRKLLGESVTFGVADSDSHVTDILGLCFAIYGEVGKWVEKNFVGKEMEEFMKGGALSSRIVPDGGDFDQRDGIINFYANGIPEDKAKKMVSVIKYYIGEHSAEVLREPYVEKSRMNGEPVWRFPVFITLPKPGVVPPELNLSNMNARVILMDVLNYPSSTIENYNRLMVAELMMKIGQVEDNDFVIGKAERKEEQSGNHFIGGLSKERIKNILEKLKEICEWAEKNNYTYISLS